MKLWPQQPDSSVYVYVPGKLICNTHVKAHSKAGCINLVIKTSQNNSFRTNNIKQNSKHDRTQMSKTFHIKSVHCQRERVVENCSLSDRELKILSTKISQISKLLIFSNVLYCIIISVDLCYDHLIKTWRVHS